jgi:tRNA G10  N-methylase Trm11
VTNYSYVEHRLKGELRPEIGCVMSLISEVDENDNILDPFAGRGSILIERAKFPYKTLTVMDYDKSAYSTLLKQTANIAGLQLIQDDFLSTKINIGPYTKIITDPPWGFYTKIDTNFYPTLLKRCNTILGVGGLLVMLVAREKATEIVDLVRGSFDLEKSFYILVSGRKATVLKLRKI